MENKRTKEALKKLTASFEADYAILILSQDRFDKVFTSAEGKQQEFAEMGEILNSLAKLMETKGKEYDE